MTDENNEQAFKHPTGNKPREVAIVCCGATVRDYIAANTGYQRATVKPCEVWTLNKGLRTIDADFGFVLDDLVGEHTKAPAYFADLCQIADKMPIITTTLDNSTDQLIVENTPKNCWGNWHEYPVHEIAQYLGADFLQARSARLNQPLSGDLTTATTKLGRQLSYYKNSVPMMLAYALYIGVETVYLYGADYSHPQSAGREADQPNAEYWVGYLRAKGLQVVLSPDTTLCSTRDGSALYGYGARQPW